MLNPELPLPSLRSLGLLNTRGGEAVSQKLPPLRFIPGRVDATAAVTDEVAWGGSLMTHTQTPQGEQPLHIQHIIDNPQRDAVPDAGTEPTVTDNVLAQAGETHPQMAGGGGETGGQEVGGPMIAFHHVDFMKINGRTRKVEWVNLSA